MSSQMLDMLQAGGIIFSILLGVFSIWFSVLQLRNQNLQQKAATSTIFSGRLQELNLMLLEHVDTDMELRPDSQSRSLLELPPPQRQRLQLQLIMRYNLYEELFVQYKKYGLIDTSDWLAWQRTIKQEFSRRRMREYWERVKSLYDPEFANSVDELIAELSSESGSIYDLEYA